MSLPLRSRGQSSRSPLVLLLLFTTLDVYRTTSTFAIHAVSTDAQLFHYEQSSLFPSLKQARLPREAIEGGKEIHVRADLESIGVAICSVEVRTLLVPSASLDSFAKIAASSFHRSLPSSPRTSIISFSTPISSTDSSLPTSSARPSAAPSSVRTSRPRLRLAGARLHGLLSLATRGATMRSGACERKLASPKQKLTFPLFSHSQQSDSVAQGLPSCARREHARERSALRTTSRPRLLRQRSRSVSVSHSPAPPLSCSR